MSTDSNVVNNSGLWSLTWSGTTKLRNTSSSNHVPPEHSPYWSKFDEREPYEFITTNSFSNPMRKFDVFPSFSPTSRFISIPFAHCRRHPPHTIIIMKFSACGDKGIVLFPANPTFVRYFFFHVPRQPQSRVIGLSWPILFLVLVFHCFAWRTDSMAAKVIGIFLTILQWLAIVCVDVCASWIVIVN